MHIKGICSTGCFDGSHLSSATEEAFAGCCCCCFLCSGFGSGYKRSQRTTPGYVGHQSGCPSRNGDFPRVRPAQPALPSQGWYAASAAFVRYGAGSLSGRTRTRFSRRTNLKASLFRPRLFLHAGGLSMEKACPPLGAHRVGVTLECRACSKVETKPPPLSECALFSPGAHVAFITERGPFTECSRPTPGIWKASRQRDRPLCSFYGGGMRDGNSPL